MKVFVILFSLMLSSNERFMSGRIMYYIRAISRILKGGLKGAICAYLGLFLLLFIFALFWVNGDILAAWGYSGIMSTRVIPVGYVLGFMVAGYQVTSQRDAESAKKKHNVSDNQQIMLEVGVFGLLAILPIITARLYHLVWDIGIIRFY